MENNTLISIKNEYMELLNILSIIDPDDEEARIINDTLEAVEGEISVKADSYVFVINDLEHMAAAKKELGQMLINSSKQLENNAKRLKDRIKYCMEQMGIKELKGNLYSYKIQGNGGVKPLKFREGVEVPQNYKKVVLENDNAKIRKSLEAGAELPFAYLEERGTQLRIK